MVGIDYNAFYRFFVKVKHPENKESKFYNDKFADLNFSIASVNKMIEQANKAGYVSTGSTIDYIYYEFVITDKFGEKAFTRGYLKKFWITITIWQVCFMKARIIIFLNLIVYI